MNKHLIIAFILLLLLLSPIAIADTDVTIQIFEDSSGDYFISVDDDELEECLDGTCIITVDNVTSSKLSSSDVRNIARQISLELNISDNTNFNTTELHALFNTVIEEKQMADRAWISTTWMPETMKYQNCTLELEQSKGALNTLDAKFAGYDGNIQAKQDTIDTLKSNLEIYKYLIMILTTAIFILLISKSEAIRALREWREK